VYGLSHELGHYVYRAEFAKTTKPLSEYLAGSARDESLADANLFFVQREINSGGFSVLLLDPARSSAIQDAINRLPEFATQQDITNAAVGVVLTLKANDPPSTGESSYAQRWLNEWYSARDITAPFEVRPGSVVISDSNSDGRADTLSFEAASPSSLTFEYDFDRIGNVTIEKTYTNGELLEEINYDWTDGRDWESVKTTFVPGENAVSSIVLTSDVGGETSVDLSTLSAQERTELGFCTPEELASRVSLLGLSPTGSTEDLIVTSDSIQYLWLNSANELPIATTPAWYEQGNGALFDPLAEYATTPLIDSSLGFIGGAMNYISPLVLDLDGDGVAADLRHIYEDGTVYFDIDADGFAERVGWVGPDDGLLARDVNGNGVIDDVTELYGDDQMPAFGKLRLHDANSDGTVTAADPDFANLLVWRDANQDGVSDEGELQTLAELGITSISANDQTDSRWVEENYISSVATFTQGGQTREIADVHFLNDNANTWFLGAQSQVYGAEVSINLEAILLPLSRGYGSLPSLHIAMTENPPLMGLVQRLAYLAPQDIDQAGDLLASMLYEWAGVTDNDPNARATAEGIFIDARQVDFLELKEGRTWIK
jgi:hypothetical protein